MIRKLLFALCVSALTATAAADNTQTVTVGGSTIEKNVTQITFEGDYIVLHFADGTTEQSDELASVKIEFAVSSAVRTLNRDNSEAPVLVFDASGILVASFKTASAAQLDTLKSGIYLIKKGTKTVKLVKN